MKTTMGNHKIGGSFFCIISLLTLVRAMHTRCCYAWLLKLERCLREVDCVTHKKVVDMWNAYEHDQLLQGDQLDATDRHHRTVLDQD